MLEQSDLESNSRSDSKVEEDEVLVSDGSEMVKGDLEDPITEEREENLVIYKIINHEITKTTANLRDKANIIPRYVATPFPPLNFNQTGKT